MKNLILIIISLFLVTTLAKGKETRREKRKAREKARMEEVQQLFSSRNLQFMAQSAHPMSGGVIHLTSEYTLDIQNEEFTAFLPFFGVAYRAEYGSSEGGIKFTEKAGKTEWKATKKGFDIRAEVKTLKDLYTLYLTFSVNGYATLEVSSLNRQPISFHGIVQQIPEKK